MVLAVKIPRRTYSRPNNLVLNSELNSNQWHGFLKSTELPNAYNPGCGYIVSANNRPVVSESTLGYFFSANDRVDRISHLIEAQSTVDLEDIKRIQQDTYVESASRLKQLIILKINNLTEITLSDKEKIFLKALQDWDANYDESSTGALAFTLFNYYFASDYYTNRYADDVAQMILSSEFLNRFMSEDLESERIELLRPIIIEAIRKGTASFFKYENWGDFHRLNLAHPLGMMPLIGKKYQYGNYPIGGTTNSAMKTAHNVTNEKHNTFYGANSRFITKLDDPDANYFVLLGGQDGWIGSEHIVDQVPLWLEGKYINFPMTINNIQATFPYRSQLEISTSVGR